MIVTWAVEAERDLVALCDRIALDDPRRALEIGDEIFLHCRGLRFIGSTRP